MAALFKTNKRSTTESVDIIESIVWQRLKPMGFRKFGRTLHRFVDGDISQVINFQNGCSAKGVTGLLWINIGIRIPECQERTFTPETPQKRYYHEYECNIRTRLGILADRRDTAYDLRKDPQKIAKHALKRIEKQVLPVFQILKDRDAILAHRHRFPRFDGFNAHLRILEEAMIYGRRGDRDTAIRLFRQYYRKDLAEYEHTLCNGSRKFLRRGISMTYFNTRTGQIETVVGRGTFVTLYDANDRHLVYLEGLADRLSIPLDKRMDRQQPRRKRT